VGLVLRTVLRQGWPPARGKTRVRGFSAAASPAPQGRRPIALSTNPQTHRYWGMCNDYEQHILWAESCKMMQAPELGIPTSS
jgi:hypothetical protein